MSEFPHFDTFLVTLSCNLFFLKLVLMFATSVVVLRFGGAHFFLPLPDSGETIPLAAHDDSTFMVSQILLLPFF